MEIDSVGNSKSDVGEQEVIPGKVSPIPRKTSVVGFQSMEDTISLAAHPRKCDPLLCSDVSDTIRVYTVVSGNSGGTYVTQPGRKGRE